MCPTAISLFSNRKLEGVSKSYQALKAKLNYLNALALRQTDPWLLMSYNKHVRLARRERVVNSIFDVDDVETSVVAFPVRDDTYSTHVAATSDHGNGACVKFDVTRDLACRQIDLDSIVCRYNRIRIANAKYPQALVSLYASQDLAQRLKDAANLRSCIMRNQVGDTSSSDLHPLNLAKFVFCLFSRDTVNSEASLRVIH